ncbi:TonB-dependent siderophore receptor [Bradyrhizobium cenepequi]|uniref:TonB-dependent siderophore receptor n=1 Tax=Bradyrhizobium cenepequi TaxID=2821403 RepID=UPI001CE23D5A|nr:TonB-dependent siderophore receptor [Bradyrhizobium cenepequi]MCA6106295.1 TonB-dependent siderophore receptor [Bradyrhizobium cenepequi]
MICLGAVSALPLSFPTGDARAQSSLPAITVDAPPQRARSAAAQPSRRATTTRTARANRAARAPQAAPIATASGPGAGERANGPVQGFVATRTGTATKTDTPIIETPQSISVITTDQIKNQGVESVGAALRYTAGVSGDVNGGSDTRFGGLQIRGFDMTMSGLYLDGLRLPSSNYVHFLGLDPYGAERLEVLKGPSSAMYGGSGTGGILNYVSKLPTAEQFGEISVSGGSFNRYQGQFDVGGAANKEGTVLWRLTGVVRDGETQVDFTKDNRIFIAPAVTFKPNDDTTITLLANYQRDQAGWGLQFLPPSGTVFPNNGRIIPVTFFGGEPNFNQFDTEQSSAGYLLSHDINEAITFRQNLRYSWMHNEQRSFYGTGYASAADEAAGLMSRAGSAGDSTINSFAVDNQLQGKFVTGILSHTTLFGMDYRNTSFRDSASSYSTGKINVFAPVYTNTWTYDGPYDDTGIKQSQFGLYAQDQIRIGGLSFLLGGRQDFVTTDLDNYLQRSSATTDASAFTGRAAVMYNLDNGIAPYFSYAESFLPVLSVNAAGELLKPETGVQYEVGVKYQPVGINALITLAAFDLTRSNVVTYAPPFNFAEQTGQVKSRGIELEGTATLREGVNIRAAYSYIDAVVTQDPVNVGKAPPTVPLNRFSLWTDYTVQDGPLAGLQIGGGIRYVDSTFGDDANTFKVPASTAVDALLAYTRDNYRFALNVTNIADNRFVAACYGTTSCFYAEGRKAIAKLTYRW